MLRHAVLDELTTSGQDRDERGRTEMGFYGLSPKTAHILDWFIRHEPSAAAAAIGEIIGEAERRLGIHRAEAERSLEQALVLHGKLGQDARDQFLTRVFTPTTTAPTDPTQPDAAASDGP